jgi:hypothetical protein
MAKKKNNKNKSITKKKSAEKDTKDLAKREYTDEEKARIANYYKRSEKKPMKFKTVESDSGNPTIELQEPDDPLFEIKLLEALGTPDKDLQKHLLKQVIHTFSGAASIDGANNGKVVPSTNNALAILAGIQPQDEIEAMLAVQMIGVHNMALDCIGKATRTERVDFMSTYMNGATKSLRTFVAQMEALKKYRSGGQQRIVVEHVNVSEGGQAIVGVVNQGGSTRGNDKKRG